MPMTRIPFSRERARSHEDEVCCLDLAGPLLVTGSGRPTYYGTDAMVTYPAPSFLAVSSSPQCKGR